MTDDQKEAIRQALDAMASARSVIDSDRTALIDANTNSTGAIVDEAAGYQIDEYDYALGAIDAAADRLARVMRESSEIGGLRKAAQTALEAWENTADTEILWEMSQLRAALAEQDHLRDATEMIGWLAWSDRLGYTFWESLENAEASTAEDFPVCPVYSRPIRREWQGLTDEEVLKAISPALHHHIEGVERETRLADARAIEQALKEKNHD